jgi:DNA-binding CsgD family transcriptional regulator
VDEGLPLATGAAARADLEHVAAAAERSGGSALRARTLMSEAAARIAGEDPTRAVVILIDAVLTAQMGGDLHAAAATARQASELANSPALRSFAELTVAQVALARGELPAAEFELIRARADGASTLALPASAAIAVEMLLSNARVEHEPVEGGRSAGIDPLIEAARRQGALGKLPFLLGHGAYIDCREGDWTRARLRASEAAELAEDTRQWNFRAWALVNLARLEAAQGLETDCRDHFAEALGLAQGHDLGSLQVHLYSLIGFLELGLGNIPTAVEQLERCAQQANDYQLGYPPIVPYEPDLIEALHAIGRDRDAAAATDLLQQRARRTQSCWGLAVVSRCRGLLAADDTYEEEFQTALSLHDRVPSAFERARTAVCYGERLRRSRRRADAREHLRSALAVFDRLGDRPWAERAHRELQATGVTARSRHDPADLDQLTPQELRVALVIAAGATVRDTADQLFLSPKTIEAHLGRAYRKLSVHNRAQLATIISRRETLGP